MTQPIQNTARVTFGRSLKASWNLAQAGILLYGVAITGFLLARLIVGERWNWVAFANNLIPWWALGNTILAGVALISRRRWLLIVCQVPGIIAFWLLYGELLLPRHPPAETTTQPPMTVAIYNILSDTSDPVRIKDAITSLDADIIGLVEVGAVHAQLFSAELAERYPYQSLHPKKNPFNGVGLLGIYPILQEEVIYPFAGSMAHLRVVLDIDGVFVTVYVAHPARPRGLTSPLAYNTDRRDADITVLCDNYLSQETGPLIVLGDFNMSDQSDVYRRVDVLLDDAFRAVGWGMGFTFPNYWRSSFRLIPRLLRIDYVWLNDDFRAYEAFVAQDSGTSDHYPVVARIGLNTEGLQANTLGGY